MCGCEIGREEAIPQPRRPAHKLRGAGDSNYSLLCDLIQPYSKFPRERGVLGEQRLKYSGEIYWQPRSLCPHSIKFSSHGRHPGDEGICWEHLPRQATDPQGRKTAVPALSEKQKEQRPLHLHWPTRPPETSVQKGPFPGLFKTCGYLGASFLWQKSRCSFPAASYAPKLTSTPWCEAFGHLALADGTLGKFIGNTSQSQSVCFLFHVYD